MIVYKFLGGNIMIKFDYEPLTAQIFAKLSIDGGHRRNQTKFETISRTEAERIREDISTAIAQYDKEVERCANTSMQQD